MNRRHFLRTLALGTAVAPQLAEIIARASTPIPARGLMFVDFADIETKPLDLDMLFELMHELKRNREESIIYPVRRQFYATDEYRDAVKAIPDHAIEKWLTGFEPYRTG